MAGAHQVKNAIAALATLSILRDRGDILITKEQIYAGFKAAKQPGRLEVLSMGQEQPMLVIDGAHNEDGAKALEDAVASFCAGKRILMVTGILVDKDVDGILAHFTAITKDFIVTEPDNPRKMAAVDLAAKIEMLGGKCRVAGSIQQACQMTKDLSSEYDVILFAGSLYMIGLVRTIIKEGQEVQE